MRPYNVAIIFSSIVRTVDCLADAGPVPSAGKLDKVNTKEIITYLVTTNNVLKKAFFKNFPLYLISINSTLFLRDWRAPDTEKPVPI